MDALYARDLACIHASAFGALALGAAPEIVRRLGSAAVPVRHVVDVGCGAGPLSAALLDAGFDVTGIDISPELLACARAAAPAARFIEASVYEVDLPPCDAIVAVGEPLTYRPAKLEQFIGQAARALAPGGLLIFDVIACGNPSLAARTWISNNDWAVGVETTEDPAAGTLTRRIETFVRERELYRRGREVHEIRLFDADEVTAQLHAHGFTAETSEAYGDQRLAPRRRAFFCALTPRKIHTGSGHPGHATSSRASSGTQATAATSAA